MAGFFLGGNCSNCASYDLARISEEPPPKTNNASTPAAQTGPCLT